MHRVIWIDHEIDLWICPVTILWICLWICPVICPVIDLWTWDALGCLGGTVIWIVGDCLGGRVICHDWNWWRHWSATLARRVVHEETPL